MHKPLGSTGLCSHVKTVQTETKGHISVQVIFVNICKVFRKRIVWIFVFFCFCFVCVCWFLYRELHFDTRNTTDSSDKTRDVFIRNKQNDN